MATDTRGRVVMFHVFISHRGPDVKKRLVNHLDEALKTAGVRAFVDYKELREGEVVDAAIKKAIRNTRLLIPVLSKGYAASIYCLDELCEIFETNAKILPVFYDVDPRDVVAPDESGSPYAGNFDEHTASGKYSAERINKWKEALRKLSGISGFCLTDCNGFEATLVKRVVSKVLDELKYIVPLEVTKHPVGLKERTDEMIKRLQLGEGSTAGRTVGICGMGGMGKTTLAKSIFNNLHKTFEAASFLSDVREKAKATNGLVDLQRQLLKDLLNMEGSDINSADQGKSILKSLLVGRSVLIVLDDVDCRTQLDCLHLKHSLGTGSRIIITSRDNHILSLAESNNIYDMPPLTNEHAQQLFYWHAFLRASAPIELQNLAEKIVEASYGHPLTLEVIGSHLYGRGAKTVEDSQGGSLLDDMSDVKIIWEDTLKQLTSRSFKEVTRRLKISYDALENQDKLMFLDIACFFVEYQKLHTAIMIWEACSWSGVINSLENLKDKSLIKVDREDQITMHDPRDRYPINVENVYRTSYMQDKYRFKEDREYRITMHNHLRDMGREIVASETSQLGKRTHLWNPKDVESVLGGEKGTRKVRGLSLTSSPDIQWTAESFRDMKELQFLVLSNTSIRGDLGYISRELRWLQWHYCQLDELPSHLSLEHVSVLDLRNSNLRRLWQHNSNFKVPFALRYLNLRWCISLDQLPEFSDLSELKELHLDGCISITRIPDSIGSLTKLQHLHLDNCNALQVFPQALGNLRCLTKLFLTSCSLLTSLPDTIGQLASLKELWLGNTSLTELPFSLGQLSNLVVLNLYKCFHLRDLPTSIGGLRNLMYLHMDECTSISRIPEEVGELASLVELRLGACRSLSELPEQMGNLRKLRILDLNHNPSLTRLPPSVTNLTTLITLNMHGICKVGQLPDEFGNLSSLETLRLQYNDISRLPTSFENLGMLVNLEMHHCEHLYEVTCLPRALRTLDIGDCPNLKMFAGLSQLANLEFLVLCNCVGLTELQDVEFLSKLLELNISGCTNLNHVSGLEKLKSLKKLFLAGSGIPVEDSGRWIRELPSLEQTCVYADNLPAGCFIDSIDQQEIANFETNKTDFLCLELQGLESSDEPCVAALFGIISLQKSASSPCKKFEMMDSPYMKFEGTLMEAKIVRGGQFIATETLFVNRGEDSYDNQFHVSIFRGSHPFLARLRRGDKIQVWEHFITRSACVSLLKEVQVAIRLVYTQEDLEGMLGILANGHRRRRQAILANKHRRRKFLT